MVDLAAIRASAFADRQSEAAWRAAVARIMAKGSAKELPAFKTADGILIAPLYPKAEGPSQQPLRAAGAPRVVQRVDHPDLDEANALALSDLEGGAAGLTVTLDGALSARGFGLKAQSASDFDRALAGVRLDLISIRVESAPSSSLATAMAFAELAQRRTLHEGSLDVDFGLDPIGALARSGGAASLWREEADAATRAFARLRECGFASPILRSDGRPYSEAGASEAQELASVVATGVAYLRALEEAGQLRDGARNDISFVLVADTDEFLTVAKFRALRRLWALVESSSGFAPAPIRLHGETAWRSLTRRDVWVNLLRGAIGSASALIGGADSVTALPFTAALGLPDEFARRLARKTSIILSEESYLARVADPAAGSGALEALTLALSEKAWSCFQDIEAAGGLPEALASGFWGRALADSRSRRRQETASRQRPLTGVSIFPNLAEATSEVLFAAPARQAIEEGLPSERDAEPFERLRDRSDQWLAAHSARPKIFLATLGDPAASTARATFARGAFEAGGFEVVGGTDYADLDALASACTASDALAACLCAPDAAYRQPARAEALSGKTQAEEAAEKLAAAGARVIMAGKPGDQEAALRASKVEDFLFAGCDLVTVLERVGKGVSKP
jgi:methylmalonyl-CoA mutase